jgi:acyl-CoA synthetase (AMP-forming)/AMP-acid ligase II
VYSGRHARQRADQAAFIMASTGESVSYAEYEARTNKLAHLLRARGLGRLDHYAIFMENNDRYLEACAAGKRAAREGAQPVRPVLARGRHPRRRPCPVPVKQQMIDWWGPIFLEYYASTEAIGFSACDTGEWLAHPGTVGKVVLGELHILDESFQRAPPDTPGTLWFRPGSPFRPHHPPQVG